MTYQMTRLRLRSIGHPDSRYRDLTIPVCDADGTPVDSLLWLVNGGGKTSLLSLLFALVVPLRRDFMGADDQERALEEYIQSGDTAHVAIEWVDLDAGGLPGLDATLPRIVTGMVHEWQGRSAPADRAADKGKLSSFYYAFTSVAGGLDLDSLPVEAEGRPRTLKDFTDQLREGGRAGHGAADLETFAGRRNAWSDYLEEDLGIDPGLYRYQVRMNAAEGAVARLFRFQSSREFIEFLIDFTAGQSGASARALEATTDNVRTLLGKLATRPVLAVEQRFSLAAAERLEDVQQANHDQAAARERNRGAHERAAVVSASLVAASAAHDRAVATAAADGELLVDALARSAAGRREAEALAAEYALQEAQIALTDAERAAADATARAHQATAIAAAWRAVPALADLTGVNGLIERLRVQLSQEHESALPVRHRYDQAAARLRSALTGRIDAAATVLAGRAEAAAGRRGELTGLESAERLARVEAARAEEAAAQRRQQAAGARQKAAAELAGPDVAGWREAPVGTSVAALRTAAGTAGADEEAAGTDVARLAEEVQRARAELDGIDERLPGLHAAVRQADGEYRSARTAEQEATEAVGALRVHGRIRELAEADDDDEIDLHGTGETLHTRLVELRHRELAEYAAHTAAASTHQAVLAAVGASGYAPPSGDAAEAIAHLRRAGFEARPGWQVLRELLPGPVEARSALRSDDVAVLAAGVVTRSDQLQEVIGLLARGAHTSAGVVAVTDRPALSAALTAAGGAAAGADVSATSSGTSSGTSSARVPADPALYDQEAARDAYAERERQAADAAGRAVAAKQSSDATGQLADRLRAVLTEFPAHECLRRQAETARCAEQLHAAEQQVGSAEAGRAVLSDTLARAAAEADERRQTAARARSARAALNRALGLLEEETEHLSAAAVHDREAGEAAARAGRHLTAVSALRGLIEQADAELRDTGTALSSLRAELDDVQLLGDDTEEDSAGTDSADLERVRAEYWAVRAEWEEKTSASDAATQLRDAESRRRQLKERLPEDRTLIERAAELLAGPDAATPAAQNAATDRAQQAMVEAESERRALDADVARAREQVAQRRPRAAEHHATLPDRPASREQAQAGAESAARRAAAQQELFESQTEEQRRLQERHRASEQAGEMLRGRARELDAGRRPADTDEPLLQAPADQRLVPAFLGLPDAAVVQPGRLHEEENVRRGAELATAEIEAALAGVHQAAAEARAVQERVTGAMTALRRLGARAEFKDVPDQIRNRVLAADSPDLLQAAGRLAADLQQRADLISRQLSDLSQDTEMVIERLVAAVRHVLGDLAKAERFARMPADTGTWSDRSFLTVRTGPMPDQSLVAERIRPVLERFAANPDALTPMALLKECVLAGAGGPQAFRVKVLKPNAAGQDHEDITKLQKFSGGEKLTICVALYCVLAKLRAHNAGRDGGGGTLVLDNPLGTASHTKLLSLQRKVAAAHGVQLVYATGVNDLGAVGEFSHRVRLRKTWHAAINRGYVDRADGPAAITSAHVGQPDVLRPAQDGADGEKPAE